MLNLELSDWLYLGGAALLIVVVLAILKVSYAAKAFSALPLKKPRFSLLPKYVVPLPIEATDVESDLSSQLAQFGFREVRRDANGIDLAADLLWAIFPSRSQWHHFRYPIPYNLRSNTASFSAAYLIQVIYGSSVEN